MDSRKRTIARFERWTSDTRPAVAKRRVLVVDDCEDIAESLVAVLDLENFCAQRVQQGASAPRVRVVAATRRLDISLLMRAGLKSAGARGHRAPRPLAGEATTNSIARSIPKKKTNTSCASVSLCARKAFLTRVA